MPEGHSVHRIARQFAANFVGTTVRVSSPQGRFAAGAALIDGTRMLGARAVGKQMFLEFEHGRQLRVHLGIYGAWDFAGELSVAPTIEVHEAAAERLRLGQTGMAATVDPDAEDSVASIGAPRRTRLRIAETEGGEIDERPFPPDPVGQVRARLLNERVCADLRGPTACEVLNAAEAAAVCERLGPDPANANTPAERDRFIERARRRRSPIALVLMDQSVVAGIGNVYRAELLFRQGLDPHTPANLVTREQLVALWDDWVWLLGIGITVGQMMTIDGLTGADYDRALRDRDERHWVYKREGQPCRRCGTNIVIEEMAARKLYWCPGCQR